ncbi:uncharacterized protein LOC662790 [Tribolium castaneum]|uniref:Peptidase S1 domain-containing protein n=1 Tax=Tribolium castaneum TaxID=7070 RepID=D6WEK2_TRICA|nr:PREDICTED: uncharacterized protein LOC662790 [Tribolium castaneum]EFA00338.1 hypothetical protein TcasGA2_TC003177 [Tribolium castaneum]|eukprot:XP_008190628.1 PREDICTED: uncharacterized protein LOC662790 [Tribolium castaneum]
MNLWYFVLLLSSSCVQLSSTDPSSKGFKLAKGIHPYVVLIVDVTSEDPIERFLASGTILNAQWVLSVAEPFKDKNASDLAIFGGSQVFTDINYDQMNYTVQNYTIQTDPPKPGFELILLQTTYFMYFHNYFWPVVYGFKRVLNRYLHCELVSWYLTTDKWVKSRVFLYPQKNSDKCKADEEYEFCIEVMSDRKEQLNPCASKINLGIPLMCDIAMEGVFLGVGDGGCDKIAQNKAYLFNKDPNIAKFLYEVQADNTAYESGVKDKTDSE